MPSAHRRVSPSWTLVTRQENDVSDAVLVATGSGWPSGAEVGNDPGPHSATKNPTVATADAMPTTLQSMPFRAGWRGVLDLIQRISVAAATTTVGPRNKIATAHSSGSPTLASPTVAANQPNNRKVLVE